MASTKISNETPAGALAGNELIPGVQGGANVKMTPAQIKTYVLAGGGGGDIASGIYTPTLSNTTNIDASTAFACQWLRVGNVVTVSGMVGIDATAATTFTVLRMTLPVASNFANVFECAGTHNQSSGTENAGVIYADVSGNLAELAFTSVATTNLNRLFAFTYLIL